MSDYQTVRGMRDFLPEEMEKRTYVISVVKTVFQKYGFREMGTPAVESMKLLSSKGGGGEEIKKEVYCFKDQGGRELGLRFDLTVPTARVVAGKPDLPKPFKRFMVGRVWRYDRPGAGRYREFWQADVDVFGSKSVLADAECVAVVCETLDALGFKDYKVFVNNRKLLEGLALSCGIKNEDVSSVFRSIDKMDKIGKEGIAEELESKGIYDKSAKTLLKLISEESLSKIESKVKDTGKEGVEEVKSFLEYMALLGFKDKVEFQASLARGLDYYTGNVFEIAVSGGKLSVSGGGRYDQLVKNYGGPALPAVGISIGIERIIQLMEEQNMFSKTCRGLIYVAPVNSDARSKALEIVQKLRADGLIVEIDLMDRKLGKQFAYADSVGASKVVVVGPKDLEKGEVTLRDMETGKEEQVKLEKLAKKLEVA
ncbi:histidine--tRNA ligase [archaeon]|nr:histidine--tRNA ligase [archaeon]